VSFDTRVKTAIIVTSSVSIAAGALGWLFTGDSRWLLLCLPILLFKT
jgi:hypothetical protein